MIKCVVVDDEPLALKKMVAYISKTPFLELVAQCDNAADVIEILERNKVDLLYLDIQMPGISGMELAKSVGQNYGIIFTTAYSQFALEGFRVDAIDYLLKPIDYGDFLKAANKARAYLESKVRNNNVQQKDGDFIFVKSDYKILKIELTSINYIESQKEYVKIHLVDGESVMSLYSLSKIEDLLPSERFMRVHRSFIVNLKQVSTIERNRIVFNGKDYIPIGDAYKEAFRSYISRNFI